MGLSCGVLSSGCPKEASEWAHTIAAASATSSSSKLLRGLGRLLTPALLWLLPQVPVTLTRQEGQKGEPEGQMRTLESALSPSRAQLSVSFNPPQAIPESTLNWHSTYVDSFHTEDRKMAHQLVGSGSSIPSVEVKESTS